MLNPEGDVVARGVSDRFGLFRVDSVPPGTYTLRVAPDQFPDAEMPTREVVITDDFLFGQDLQLPFVVEDRD
jgi:hypothetical protein